MPESEGRNRGRAIATALAGGGLVAAGSGLKVYDDAALKRAGSKSLLETAAVNTVRGRGRHRPGRLPFKPGVQARHVGRLMGARGLQLTGLPLLAVGARNAVTGSEQRKLDAKDDVVRPLVRNAVLADQAEKGRVLVGKGLMRKPRPVAWRRQNLDTAPDSMPLNDFHRGKSGWVRYDSPDRREGDAARRLNRTIDRIGATTNGGKTVGQKVNRVFSRYELKKVPPSELLSSLRPPGHTREAAGTLVLYKRPFERIPAVQAGVPLAVAGAGAEAGRRKVGKSMADLSPEQRKALRRHRRAAVALSATGGTLGLAALGSRAPAAAKVLANRGVKGRLIPRLAAAEESATKHSNTLGVGAIGVGSLSSFNWAAQQRLESKQNPVVVKALPGLVPRSELVAVLRARDARVDARVLAEARRRLRPSPVSKGLPRYIHHAGRARRVLGYDPQRKMLRLENPSDPANPYLVPRGGQRIPEPLPDPVAEVKARRAQGVQLTLPFGKSDRWMRVNRDRVSPEAEEGYERVRQLRNEQRVQAVGGAALAGLTGGLLAQELKRAPRNKTAVAATLAGSVLSGHESVRSARHSRELQGRLGKIRRRGEARAAAGLYGRGRGLEPVDVSSRSRARNLAGGV